MAEVRYPLAVRSSSLLEDSQYLPFTAVYETFMLTNQHADLLLRLQQLIEAIKRVLRFDLQRACEGLRKSYAIPPGRGEDGSHPSAGGGHDAYHTVLS